MNLYYRLGAAVLLIAAASAQADTLRCGSQLVTTGDRAFEVERKCGVPQHRDLVGYSLSRLAFVVPRVGRPRARARPAASRGALRCGTGDSDARRL